MKYVELIKREHLGVLITRNPPYNIFSTPVFMDLQKGLEQLREDDDIKVIILTGQGIFSAGADVTEINELAKAGQKDRVHKLLSTARRIIDTIEHMPRPVIAAVDGYCLGGGNEIVLACTACVASDQAQFGQPEIKLGLIPGLGGTQRLPRRIGVKRALEMLMTGNFLTAKEAHDIGLVDMVVPQKHLTSQAKEFALHALEHRLEKKQANANAEDVDPVLSGQGFRLLMAAKSQDAVNALVRAVKEGLKLPLAGALNLETEIFCDLLFTPDAREGLTAFIEKRPPEFPSMAASGEKNGEKPTAAGAPSDTAARETEKRDGVEYDMLRRTVAEFARKEIAPRIDQMEREERIPPVMIRKMGEMGFYGVCCPETYGGSGFGKRGYCVLFEELSRVHASSAVFVGAHVGLAGGVIQLFGSEEQKQKYLVPAIKGGMVGAFALTEPEAGSDAANVQTRAEKKDGRWVLNGSKHFITNGDQADFVVVIAQTDRFLGTKGLAAFIVESGWPGFSVGKIENKIGIKAARTASLSLEDLEVPEENMLGRMGQGFKIFMNALNGGRLGLAAGCLGAAKEAFKLAYEHASQRVQFNKLLIEQEAIQFYFAEMKAKIYLMESAVYRAAEAADRGEDYRTEAAILKLTCSEMCSEVIDTALQIFGGYGYIEEYPIARMYRDARINRIFEGTNEIQKLMIFKEIYKSGGSV